MGSGSTGREDKMSGSHGVACTGVGSKGQGGYEAAI